VVRNESPADVRKALGADCGLPETGVDATVLLDEAAKLVFDHSLFNGHPRFFGYITSSPAPIGALGDLLASAVNQNVGAWRLAPMATEIEAQTIRWIAELIGVPQSTGGLLVSGGNMANFIGVLAARQAVATWDVRAEGNAGRALRMYCSSETHTWVQKAADMFGMGTASIRWIETDAQQCMRPAALRAALDADRAAGDVAVVVVGTAGSVSTGAVDPLPELRRICDEYQVWLHVDGAYGGVAVCLPDAAKDLAGLRLADSVAVDPHKWLYAPAEAGAVLVRKPKALVDAFSYRPPYYHLDEETVNYYERGPQNSRGFRALKVWLTLRQAGRRGYIDSIAEDCRLARVLYELCDADPELEAKTCNLSITTFRYRPRNLDEQELDRLNEELLERLQGAGDVFVSNAVIDGRFYLRSCIVNFRTSERDLRALVEAVKRVGAEAAAQPVAR